MSPKFYIHMIEMNQRIRSDEDFNLIGDMIGKEINTWLAEYRISGELLFQPFIEKPSLDNRENTFGYLGTSFHMSEKPSLEKIVNYFSSVAAAFQCSLAFWIYEYSLDSSQDLLFFSPFSLAGNDINIHDFHGLLLAYH